MMSAVQKYFGPGQYLFREGDPSKHLYLIVKGTIAIRKVKGSGFIEIAKVHSNEVIGELSFFDRLPRSAAAIAVTDVEVMEISFESLEKIYSSVPDYLKTIMTAVAARLRRANDTIRRLQKEFVNERGKEQVTETEPDAASILALTAGIGGMPKQGTDTAD